MDLVFGPRLMRWHLWNWKPNPDLLEKEVRKLPCQLWNWSRFRLKTASGGDRAPRHIKRTKRKGQETIDLLTNNKMYKLKCPHCRIKLGNFLYADACPYCHEELKHNTRLLVSVIKKDSQKSKSWPGRFFSRIVRIAES
jgi:hypothetical protein